jgi:hypothetical protein
LALDSIEGGNPTRALECLVGTIVRTHTQEVPMKKTIVIAAVILIASALGGCPKLYTQADINDTEFREDTDLRTESVIDPEIAEEGGTNTEALEDEREEVYRESDR